MRLIDLSQPLFDDCPNCPAHPAVQSKIAADHPRDGWRLEMLTLASHTGSHLDAPLHKLAGGKAIDAYPLESFVCDAFVADVTNLAADEPITAALLLDALADATEGSAALLATGWGRRRTKSDDWLRRSPFLSIDGAEWLVERGVRGVGIDHYSIGGSREPHNGRVHEILLSRGIWILEELNFSDEALRAPRPSTLWTLPINLRGHSGAFCRPVLAVERES